MDSYLKKLLYGCIAVVPFSKSARSRYRRSHTRIGGMVVSILIDLDGGDRLRCLFPDGRSLRLWFAESPHNPALGRWMGGDPTDVDRVEIILRLSE